MPLPHRPARPLSPPFRSAGGDSGDLQGGCHPGLPPGFSTEAPACQQVPTQGESAQGQEHKQGWQDQVVGDRGDNPQKLDQDADDHESVIVVINVAASVPGIVRREGRALEDGIEKGEIHWLFAAKRRVPQVRVAKPDEQIHGEKHQGNHLDHPEITPALPPLAQQVFPLDESQDGAGKRDRKQGSPDRHPGEGNFCRPGQPDQIGQD